MRRRSPPKTRIKAALGAWERAPADASGAWTNADLEHTAHAISALAHPLRLSIVSLLAQGERSVSELCEQLWSSQPNISHHLWILHSRNLISARKDASRMFYALTDRRLGALATMIPTPGS
ncbi:metalloregulator ArsR/SmtB family transcription factor [uncultured Dechloromonas sp.]|uniref:ArsR/SmtB family transcription factor n=1 Tax=uncultured Dechloromonas sp. TaxID=171719 RepID=UPI0025D74333|nr:metalloregulator ArsR/SmtB family transcription factor [uncultured Dechloromonas sp.]